MHKIIIKIPDADNSQDLIRKARDALDLADMLLEDCESPPPESHASQGKTELSILQVYKE